MFIRRFAAAVTVAAGAFLAPVVHAPSACAATAHHAALIIDTGDGNVVRKCVGFNEDSISGKDMLDRANVNVVYSDKYSEAFVCSILGVGNDQAHCPNSTPQQNWFYWEAKAGSSSFPATQSSAGASRTTVHDGDVEGWAWGRETPPPYSSPADVCGPSQPPPTPAPATQPSPTPTTASQTSPTGRPGSSASSTGATSSTVPTTSTSSSSIEPTTSRIATSTTAASKLAIRRAKNDKGGSPFALAVVGAIVVGLGVASAVISRRRRVRG